jgi:hypothetical protein
MLRRSLVCFLAAYIGLASSQSSAESRGKPYSEMELLERSQFVFVGEVSEMTAFAKYERIVPTEAQVLLSVKGAVPRGKRKLLPKDPGKFAYFNEEFSSPGKGKLGVFYVGTQEQPDLLLGYRQINK